MLLPIQRSSTTGVVEAVRKMLDPARRCQFVTQVEKQNNRAVFEIPEILAGILSEGAAIGMTSPRS